MNKAKKKRQYKYIKQAKWFLKKKKNKLNQLIKKYD